MARSETAELGDRQLLKRIETFIEEARQPALVEPGAQRIAITRDGFEAALTSRGLRLQIWDEVHNLSRLVLGVRSEQSGRLELEIERFGRPPGRWILMDRARASNRGLGQRLERTIFAEEFRAFLNRQFAGWTVEQLSAVGDLQRSLSANYPRAYVQQGRKAWAALAAPRGVAADGALTFALIWLAYLRQNRKELTFEGLALFLPKGTEMVTCLRLGCLDPSLARVQIFTFDSEYCEQPIDAVLHGNLETTLLTAGERAIAAAPHNSPEGWMEARVRARLTDVDGLLLPEPIYGQVPALAGIDRGVLDLLAVDTTGRLAVIELKAGEDIHLPMQALDYWMRVTWHAARGEFAAAGYFPELPVSREPPRLLLVSPALHFHPATETLLSFYSKEIDVERIGIGVESKADRLGVAFRLKGRGGPWHLEGHGDQAPYGNQEVD